MPQGFDMCQEKGGKMRTISGPNKRFGLKKGEYMHICIDKKGVMNRGYVKKKSNEHE